MQTLKNDGNLRQKDLESRGREHITLVFPSGTRLSV